MCGPQQAPRLRGRRGLSTTRTIVTHTHASTHTPQRENRYMRRARRRGPHNKTAALSDRERERRPPGYEREGRDIIINPYCQPHIRRAARGVCTFCADERTHIVPTVCIATTSVYHVIHVSGIYRPRFIRKNILRARARSTPLTNFTLIPSLPEDSQVGPPLPLRKPK